MKTQILAIALITLFCACDKEDTPTNNDLLQGEWKIILLGNGGNLRPYEASIITEYYDDSLYRGFDPEINQYIFHAKYSIEKDRLTQHFYYPEDTLHIRYRCEFYDDDKKLKLELQNPSTFDTSVFERITQ